MRLIELAVIYLPLKGQSVDAQRRSSYCRIRSRHSVGRRWSNLQTSIVFLLCIRASA